MGKQKYQLLSDISISSMQAVVNKLSGLFVFFILSQQLDKNSFGMLNWILAVVTVVFTLSGFGTDQLAVKKTAVKEDPADFLGVYFFHVFFSGLLFLILIGLLLLLGNYPAIQVKMFWLLSLSQCLIYFSTAFKNIANGAEKFRSLFVMSTCAGICRAFILAVCLLVTSISVETVLWIYLFAAFAELLLSLLIYRLKLKMPFLLQFRRSGYRALVTEALPMLGTSVLNIALARFDWILLGLITTAALVADYSFAYRLFEMSSLPAWIISPVILPRIAKMFATIDVKTEGKRMQQIHLAVRWQLLFALFTGIVLSLSMPGIIYWVSGNKYGINTYTPFMILMAAMPLMYLNNTFWSINFALGKNNLIFICALVTFLVNVITDLLLIPFYSANGAAWGFVLATVTQSIYYVWHAKLPGTIGLIVFVLMIYLAAILGLFFATAFFTGFLSKLLFALSFYIIFLVVTGQLAVGEWQRVKKILVS